MKKNTTANQNKKLTVEKLFKDYNSDVKIEELNWGEDVGREIIKDK